MMKRELRDRWVAALRSGDFKQGNGFLKREKRFDKRERRFDDVTHCCLGVLHEVDGGEWERDDDIYLTLTGESVFITSMTGSRSSRTLMGQLLRGLSHTHRCMLTVMNDNGKTFEEIADWIERNVEVRE